LGALLATSGLGMLFAVAVGSAWWRELDISCDCFGALVGGQVNAWHILSALLFVGVGSVLLVCNGRLRANHNQMDKKRS
jgi:Methylamine utilisation protein MauE